MFDNKIFCTENNRLPVKEGIMIYFEINYFWEELLRLFIKRQNRGLILALIEEVVRRSELESFKIKKIYII